MVPLPGAAPSLVAAILRRQPLSHGKVALAWQMAVGAQIARATDIRFEETPGPSPKYVLRVRARDARWAGELERARATVLERLKTLVGVDRLALEITI